MNEYFVFMADVVDSSAKPSDKLIVSFKELVLNCNEYFADSILSPLTITLGDEFQGVVKDLSSAIDIIFYLDQQLLLEKVDYQLRFVVNYGTISTKINKNISYEMLGDGLTKARKLLTELKSTHYGVRITGIDLKMSSKLNLAFELYRSIYNDWQSKDRTVAALFLEYNDYRKVAVEYNRDPSSMWRREKSLKIREFNVSKKLIRKISNE